MSKKLSIETHKEEIVIVGGGTETHKEANNPNIYVKYAIHDCSL